MLPTEELFVYVYVLIHDLMLGGAIVVPDRPGPAPACTDAELLAIAIVRHLLAGAARAGFLAEVARDWGHLFPRLPHQSRPAAGPAGCGGRSSRSGSRWRPKDDCQRVDTSALPVKHPSRVRGPDRWTGPGNDLAARFGCDAAHAEWFYGFRLAVRTDLGSRIVRGLGGRSRRRQRARRRDRPAGSPAGPARPAPDKGFVGRAFEAELAACGTAVLVPPDKRQPAMLAILLKVIAEWRNRIETTFSEITGRMELARHGAHTFWGLLTRTAATIAAHTLQLTCLTQA